MKLLDLLVEKNDAHGVLRLEGAQLPLLGRLLQLLLGGERRGVGLAVGDGHAEAEVDDGEQAKEDRHEEEGHEDGQKEADAGLAVLVVVSSSGGAIVISVWV